MYLIPGVEPGLLKTHSSFVDYRTPDWTYPSIRTFFHPHPQAAALPKEPKPLPVIVFVHGLGGSIAQFHPLLTSLVNVGPCFGIDLPGCGQSGFQPESWAAYSHASLVDLLDSAISDACVRAKTDEVVLVCHSMGCSLAASLLSRTADSPAGNTDRIQSMIAICPKISSPTVQEVRAFRRLLSVPSQLFNIFRAWDRRGGVESPSVKRFVGERASVKTKKLQLEFNEHSRTDVWRRMAWGAIPTISQDGSLAGGLPDPQRWARISVPLFVIAGESDQVTKPREILVLTEAVRNQRSTQKGAAISAPDTEICRNVQTTPSAAPQSGVSVPDPVFKTTVLPLASHGLLYDHATYRTLSGLILTFLAEHVSPRLDMGWQLQYLKDSNKWDVKNLAKWQAVTPVSDGLANIFRALKTLRDGDEIHSPTAFTAQWSGRIKAVIDISHDSPVYNPHDLEKGGIEYHKFPTVSKIPPTTEEVRGFIALVDQLRLEENASEHGQLIGVHCHYGFNRTGFFICSYLIEREGFSVHAAVDEFAKQRPNGIRHEHFLDTLFMRYCVGLKRAPTM